jgi:hypothetical protein
MGAERRRHPRFEILAQVKLAKGATTYVLDVQNVSVSGACVTWSDGKAPHWLENGKRVTMDLVRPDVPGTLSLSGEIVHVGSGAPVAIGVRFDEKLPEGSREKLDALVAQAAADSTHPPPLPR